MGRVGLRGVRRELRVVSGAQGIGGPELRVILVGRTGLDARLRLDPAVELVRVKSALAAVGEVADAADRSARTVVVVAPDAEPESRSDADDELDHPAEFLRAVRTLNPGAKVVRLSGASGAGDSADIYDAVVKSDATTQTLRALFGPASMNGARTAVNGSGGGREHISMIADAVAPVATGAASAPTSAVTASSPAPPAAVPASVAAPTAPQAPSVARRAVVAAASSPTLADFVPPKPAAGGASTPVVATPSAVVPELGRFGASGDEPLVRLMLRGRDLVPAALAMIRERLGRREVMFMPGAGPASNEGASVSASVAWEDHVYGVLRAERVAPSELDAQAAWLAGWLRLRDQQAQLREAAFTDPCTGAYNRRYCEKFLSGAMEEARRERRPLTILFFDLDNFKTYNDLYGHAAGDLILNEVVKLLQACVRPSDRVCRVGGDEFVVIFHEPDGPRQPDSKPPTNVFQIARRFQKQILEHRFPKLGLDAPGNLTISGGLVSFPWDGNTPAELLEKADQLCLASKRQGKNVVTIGPGAMTQERAETRYDEGRA